MNRLEPFSTPLVGEHLIEASAGTGKTYTITTLFLRLLLEKHLNIREILVVTFTRAATAELRERIRERIRGVIAAFTAQIPTGDAELDAYLRKLPNRTRAYQQLTQALSEFDTAAIFTIHGFAQRMLRENAFETGTPFTAELLTDERTLRHEVVADFWASHTYEEPVEMVRYLLDNRTGLKQLGAIAARTSSHPELVIISGLPEPTSGGSTPLGLSAERANSNPDDASALGALVEVFCHCRNALSEIWLEQRETIRTQLSTYPGLDRRSYSSRFVEGVSEKLDRYCSKIEGAELAQVISFPELARLSSDKVAAACKKGPPLRHPFFDRCSQLLEAYHATQQFLQAHAIQLRLDLIRWTEQELRRRKHVAGTFSFEDLLRQLNRSLGGPRGPAMAQLLRKRYRAALIDEFQDTDPLQHRIFHSVFGGCSETSLFMIGDPKQAIYGFRGADIFAYLRAAREVVPGHRWTLSTNWRSDPRLLHAVNSLFSRTVDPFVLSGIAFHKAEARAGAIDLWRDGAGKIAPALELLLVLRDDNNSHNGGIRKEWMERQVAPRLAHHILKLLQSGYTIGEIPLEPGHIAILCRKKDQAYQMQEALRAVGIPGVLHTDESVFDTQEALELFRVLRSVIEPTNNRLRGAALVTSMLGFDAELLVQLETDERSLEKWSHAFLRWHAEWRERGFIQAFRQALNALDIPARLLRRPDGERRMTNILHLAELLHRVSLERHPGMVGLVQWLSDMRAADSSSREEFNGGDAQLRLESDSRAVSLVTIHKSKGLEFPVVFCPFLWDGSLLRGDEKHYVYFHDPEDGYIAKLDLRGEKDALPQKLAEKETLAESLRLAYVALTRARHHCVVVWGGIREAESSALGWLLHGDPVRPVEHQLEQGARDDAVDLEPAFQRIKERLASDAELLNTVQQLEQQTQGAIHVGELGVGRGGRWTSELEKPRLQSRRIQHPIDRRWRVTSFTQLVGSQRSSGQAFAPDKEEDELAGSDLSTSARGESQSVGNLLPSQGSRSSEEPRTLANDAMSAGGLETHPLVSSSEPKPVPLAAFERGVRAGLLFHNILESLDFDCCTEEELAQVVEHNLRRLGEDLVAWREVLTDAMGRILDTPLGAPADGARTRGLAGENCFRLRDISREKRQDEMEFLLPMCQTIGDPAGDLFDPSHLRRVMTRANLSRLIADYGERLLRLRFLPVKGYLRGFIDLVFEHGGRYYLVDYKSNYLGERGADYAPAGLALVMMEHHYVLQYHLYLVALHRYLQLRLPGYHYQTHIGGVLYLFLRGMTGSEAARQGVFFDCPSASVIEALSVELAGVTTSPRHVSEAERKKGDSA